MKLLCSLVVKGLRGGKARFACAVAGLAIATGTLVFMTSFVATNAAQAERRAEALLRALPLEDSSVVGLTMDYRPGGHVLQGPPMRATCLISASLTGSVVRVSRALFAQRRLSVPPVGTSIKLVGRAGTYMLTIGEVLDWEKPVRGVPNVFVSSEAAAHIGESWSEYRVPTPAELAPALKGDEQRRMDYARPLLLIAALLTALSLLVNSILLSIESNRSTLALLRTIGLTRLGVVGFVALESVFAGLVGWTLGVVGALLVLAGYVSCDPVAFPAGLAVDGGRIALTLAVLPIVVFLAVLFALAPALRVRGMEASLRRPRSRRRGMAITFACGFAAFVAVEVWGASLMRGFIPSVEWPDAIVSLLPAGVSSYEVEKLRDVAGVRRVSELVPRQLAIPGRDARDNALFLAAEWLPKFNFIEGTWSEAEKALATGDAVVITRMMATALNLHKGDRLVVGRPMMRWGGTEKLSFPIAGVVDLNWHMVTSRGLVRGLNRMPVMTMGPVFCSLDTMGIVDPRTYMTEPSMSAPMTHLWVEYDPAFLAKHGVFAAGRLVEAEIARKLGNPTTATVRLHARDEIADGTLAHGSDVIGQAARVPFVFLAILAIGFVAMLVGESEARRREFEILHAVGMTRAQLTMRLAAIAVKTALVGMFLGLPVGALAGWLTSIPTAAHWPGMPHWFVVPWSIIAEGALGALVFALVIALPTAISLVRTFSQRSR